ncbi:MAG TPA: 23S rRNA pseudouridine(1911/1915/1917) synthase RluD [Coxiellaceae bacterium]|nr:23S rRNA pseudouridine(1911/1915/1917) synthase RluD [Coxiellaceae bacterium]
MNPSCREIIIPETCAPCRLDQALKLVLPEFSRSQLKEWIEAGHVKLNEKICTKARSLVQPGNKVFIKIVLKARVNWGPQSIPLTIIYEDDHLLVLNKPAGLVVHPGAGVLDNTLVNGLLHYCPSLENVPRSGIIHRLDKDTTGLLIVAKTLEAHAQLVQQMQAREVQRTYEAIVVGKIIAGSTINQPIGRDPHHRTRFMPHFKGKHAVTHYRVLHRYPAHTHLQIRLETGRTHQIRVHMASIHHPLVGDPVYGKRSRLPGSHFCRQALHARALRFAHPITHELLEFKAPLPDDMITLIDVLKSFKARDK